MNPEKQTIGILTSGGLAQGLNAVISSTTQVLQTMNHNVIGIRYGWKGMLEESGKEVINLGGMTRRELRQILSQAGTILGSSRTHIKPDQFHEITETAKALGLTGLIAIGGDGSLSEAREIHESGAIQCIGVPKTIDNDIEGTDRTFGFDTACNEAAKAIRRMRTEATSMDRVAIVEIMGRNAGWIALHGGEAGGADITLIPEFPIAEEALMSRVQEVYYELDSNERPARSAVIAIAEGFLGEVEGETDAFGKGQTRGAAAKLAQLIKQKTGLSTQEQVVGYQVRNETPLANDAIFAAKMGAHAAVLASAGIFGRMVSLRGGEITDIPFSEVSGGRIVTEDLYDPKTMSMRFAPKNIQETIRQIRTRILGTDSPNDNTN